LQFEADRRAIIITINSFGTELSKDDRAKLWMEGASGARQRRALKSESKDVVGDIERKLELRRPETAVAGATGLDVFLILEILPGSKDPKVDIELELEFLGSGTAAAGSTVSPQSQ